MNAAMGFRVHSGWAAVVALGEGTPSPRILDRRRIELVDPGAEFGNQPYHAVQELDPSKARPILDRARARIFARAAREVQTVARDLEARGAKVRACGILVSASRLPDSLEKILRSHPLLHSAEGVLYRDAVSEAASLLDLKVVPVVEKDLLAEHARRVGVAPPLIEKALNAYKKEVGPPFRQDEKWAALAAWIALV